MRKTILTRTVKATGGRNGSLATPEGKTWTLGLPKELGGDSKPETTNPEELFAAGYSACFASSLEYILMTKEVAYETLMVTAKALLLKDDAQGGFKFAIDAIAHIEGLPLDEAQKYVDEAYGFCPYSRAIKGNVDVKIEVK